MLNQNFGILSEIFQESNISFLQLNKKRKIIDFCEFLDLTNSNILYIKSGSTGHTFKGIIKKKEGGEDVNYAIKIVAYQRKKQYGPITNINRPENVDIRVLELLSDIVKLKKTPHLILPFGCFFSSIEPFVSLRITTNTKYNEFKENYEEKKYHNHVSVLISEWAEGGDLLDFIRNSNEPITKLQWKVIFFQIIFTLTVIQDIYPSFRHNDLKCNNILIQKDTNYNKKIIYKLGESLSFSVPNINIQIKIWDFDFASIDGIIDNLKIENKWSKKINIKKNKNNYYDLHFFFNTLIKKGVSPELLDPEITDKEVVDFINRVIPEKYRTSKTTSSGRILLDDEFVTPKGLLFDDPFFYEFKYTKSRK